MEMECTTCEVRTGLYVLLQVASISQLTVSRLSRQCGILNISQTYRPPRPVAGIAFNVVESQFLNSVFDSLWRRLHILSLAVLAWNPSTYRNSVCGVETWNWPLTSSQYRCAECVKLRIPVSLIHMARSQTVNSTFAM
jgi:hypothetical protein